MHEPLKIWTGLTFRLALVLLALAFVPLVLVRYVFVAFDPLIPILLLYSLAPPALITLAVAGVLFLIGLLRRRPPPPAA